MYEIYSTRAYSNRVSIIKFKKGVHTCVLLHYFIINNIAGSVISSIVLCVVCAVLVKTSVKIYRRVTSSNLNHYRRKKYIITSSSNNNVKSKRNDISSWGWLFMKWLVTKISYVLRFFLYRIFMLPVNKIHVFFCYFVRYAHLCVTCCFVLSVNRHWTRLISSFAVGVYLSCCHFNKSYMCSRLNEKIRSYGFKFVLRHISLCVLKLAYGQAYCNRLLQ